MTPVSLLPHPLLLEHYKSAADRQMVIPIATRASWVILVILHSNKFTEWQVYFKFSASVMLSFMCVAHSSFYPTTPTILHLLTCAVGLSRVGGEADYLQVGELGGHVVFPGNHQWGRTQVGFVQHQDHLLP